MGWTQNAPAFSICGGRDFSSASFAQKIDLATPNNPFGVSIADIDGDGKPELVVSNGSDVVPNTISVFQNNSTNGSFLFAPRKDFTTDNRPWGLALGDFDKDGKLDVATANIDANSVSVLKNTSSAGNVTMANTLNLPANSGAAGIAIRDVDGDGMVDVVIANDTRTLSIIRNTTVTGNISFANKVDYAIKGASYSISISDLDGDGKLDFVTANYEPSSVSVFRYNSTIGNILLDARQDFTTGDNPFYATIGDIDGDGKTRFDCNKCRFINRFDF